MTKYSDQYYRLMNISTTARKHTPGFGVYYYISINYSGGEIFGVIVDNYTNITITALPIEFKHIFNHTTHQPPHIGYSKTKSSIHCIFPNKSLIYTLLNMAEIPHI
jgi:hypothetical protein